jgi:hypothetical protein
MAEQDLITIFNDCVDALAAGQTLEDCLRRYPAHVSALRPMLEAGLLVRQAAPMATEVMVAQRNARQRFEGALAASMPARRQPYPFQRWATLAAGLLLAFILLTGGAAFAAQSSLPGDPLYGLKRFTEQVQLSLGSTPTLLEQFAKRRIDEIGQLLSLEQAAEVEFEGKLQAMNGDNWLVGGLPVTLNSATRGAEGAAVGDIVRINGYTTASGELIARDVTLVRHLQTSPAGTPTPAPTVQPTVTHTLTGLPTIQPTLTPSHIATRPAPSVTPSATATRESTPFTMPAGPTLPLPDCTPTLPSGWTIYQIQPGDTLSGLAANRGVSLDQVLEVNCLAPAAPIIVGQRIYLPPGVNGSPVSSNSGPGSSNSGSGSSSSGENKGPGGDDSGHEGGENEDSGGSGHSGPG